MLGELYPRFRPDFNVPYLIRLHHNAPLLTKGKFGEYYYTHIDVWKPDGTSDSAINKMIAFYKEGVPPQIHFWTVSESFVRLWINCDLIKNSIFLMVRKNKFSARHNKDYPYYEVKIIGGPLNNKVFSTIDFTEGDISATQNRFIDDPDSMDIQGIEPQEFRLTKVNPDVLALYKDSVLKASEIFTEVNIIYKAEDIITTAKTLFYETLKKGWTTNEGTTTGNPSDTIGKNSSDPNTNE